MGLGGIRVVLRISCRCRSMYIPAQTQSYIRWREIVLGDVGEG